MNRFLAMMVAVVRSGRRFRVVGRRGGAGYETARPCLDGRHGKRDRVRIAESAMHDRCLLLDDRLSGCVAGSERGTKITWTWRVDSDTKPGTWPVKIDGGKSGKAQTSVTVRR